MSPSAPGIEEDFPRGHPARGDYDPTAPEAIEWARRNIAPLGERDFPVDHPGAVDTAGNVNRITYQPGVDPFNPHREAHTGRTPAQVEGIRRLSETASRAAVESPVLQPVDAAAVNAALDQKRIEVRRDVLTADEYREVLAGFQEAPREPAPAPAPPPEADYDTRALAMLTQKGWREDTARAYIAREGAEKLLRLAGVIR